MPARARLAGRAAATALALCAAAAATPLRAKPPGDSLAAGDDAYSAVLRARTRAVLSAPADGLVARVAAREGERVAAGEPLVDFDCALADAALERARARLDYARVDAASNAQLAALDSVSDLQLAASDLQVAEATSDVATASRAAADCTVLAPFDGVVTARSVEPHERVAAGTTLVEVVDDGSLVVEFLAPSHAVGRLRPGAAFDVEIGESGATRAGTVEAVVPEIDPVSRTLTVIGRLDDVPAGDDPSSDASPDDASDVPLVSGMSGWVALR